MSRPSTGAKIFAGAVIFITFGLIHSIFSDAPKPSSAQTLPAPQPSTVSATINADTNTTLTLPGDNGEDRLYRQMEGVTLDKVLQAFNGKNYFLSTSTGAYSEVYEFKNPNGSFMELFGTDPKHIYEIRASSRNPSAQDRNDLISIAHQIGKGFKCEIRDDRNAAKGVDYLEINIEK